jgi:hypothetical protein
MRAGRRLINHRLLRVGQERIAESLPQFGDHVSARRPPAELIRLRDHPGFDRGGFETAILVATHL